MLIFRRGFLSLSLSQLGLSQSMRCFSCAVNLINTIVNWCYWQFGWILFYSKNMYPDVLAEAESDISQILWLSLSQNMKCAYFLNETISSQIASNYDLN